MPVAPANILHFHRTRIIPGQQLTWQEFKHTCLQEGQAVVEADNGWIFACDMRGILDHLSKGVALWTAQVIALTNSVRGIQAVREGQHHIFDKYRLKLRFG